MSRITLLLLIAAMAEGQTFLEKPYLQLGGNARGTDLVLMWHSGDLATDRDAAWKVELKDGNKWRAAGPAEPTVVKAPAVAAHRVYRAALTGLKSGEEFTYRVSKDGKVVFEATGRGRKDAGQKFRFVTFGDTAQGTPAESAVVYQTYRAKPDFVFVDGDIVYGAGRIEEYRLKYFPIFNADEAKADGGAPLIRSVPFIAAPGNHDTGRGNFAKFGDAMAYFLYWDQPLNGPIGTVGAKSAPIIEGNDAAKPDFLAGAKERFPRMANFSFDYGNSHWLVLDSNNYTDWTDPELRAWIKKDLDGAQGATWRFVGFHHPGFNSAEKHFDDQWMRVLSDVFEAGKVDVVFAGHVHNYQRTYPLTFVAKPHEDGKLVAKNGDVAGEWTLDKSYGDGAKARPKGVIYIVTGGGGAELYNPEMQKKPETWQPFTNKFISEVHSFTVVDIDGKKFQARQLSDTGAVVDSFEIKK
jgi:acid phosphatase type 7